MATQTDLWPRPSSATQELDPALYDKLRGGYYTPAEVATWLCRWAIRSASNRILEPSCGDGVFLEASARRLLDLGARPDDAAAQLLGMEIAPGEAAKAVSRLHPVLGWRGAGSVHPLDFFEWLEEHPDRAFDSALGNPPFIRYQNFPEASRSRAMAMMSGLGLRPNRLTNSWVPFVVGATARLASGGRLAMVLPAELLQVSYAAQLRSFLAENFASIQIFACNHLFFDRAEQEVLLLLASGRLAHTSARNRCRIGLREASSLEEILSSVPPPDANGEPSKTVEHDSEKWLKYFLTAREISFMRALRRAEQVAPLSYHATVDVGIVTGENSFFVLSQDQVDEHGLQDYVVPLVGRSSQLKGAVLRRGELRAFAAEGQRVFLFSFHPSTNGDLSAATKRYVSVGEERGVHRGYKCSVRDPWYAIPSAWRPDCFLFRQIYNFPRVVLNRAEATSTDTIHRMRCGGDAPRLAANLYTHVTAASAEIEGRSYGGGVLELEPTEAERLLVPRELADALPVEEVDRLVRDGRIEDVLQTNDRRVLIDSLGLSLNDCAMLRRIWKKMRNRRLSRQRRTRR